MVTEAEPGPLPAPVSCPLAGALCIRCSSLDSPTLNHLRLKGQEGMKCPPNPRRALVLMDMRLSQGAPSWWPGKGGTDATLGYQACPAHHPTCHPLLTSGLCFISQGGDANVGEPSQCRSLALPETGLLLIFCVISLCLIL